MNHDVIVIGLGAVGSACAYQLAKRGKRVLGLDRQPSPSAADSRRSDTLISFEAFDEKEGCGPFTARSLEILKDIERITAVSLFTRTGGLILSDRGESPIFRRTLSSARARGIKHELLKDGELRARFPAFRVQRGNIGYYEPGAGYFRPERCVSAQLVLAERHGAQLLRDEEVLEIRQDGRGVCVRTVLASYRARRALLCVGTCLPEMLGEAHARPFLTRRQAHCWYAVDDAKRFLPGNFPVFVRESEEAGRPIFGLPAVDGIEGGIKVIAGELRTVAEASDLEINDLEARVLHRLYADPYLVGVRPEPLRTEARLHTMTPDSGFVIDRHPEHADVTIVSVPSGEGFRRSAAIGEAIGQRFTHKHSDLVLTPFRLDRFDDLQAIA